MLTADIPVTTLTLRELADSRYRFQLDSGDFWRVIKDLSQLSNEPDVKCYENLFEAYLQTEEKFIFAVCCINIFIQNNFTGPLLSFRSSTEDFDKNWVKSNSELNFQVYPLTRCLKFLEVATQHFSSSPNDSFTNKLFHLRCVYLKEVIFEDVRPSSYDGFVNLVSDLEEQLDNFPSFSAPLQSTLFVEFGCMYMFYSQLTKSNRYIEKAQELVNFEFRLTGAMGRRTKWQTKETAQLKVEMSFKQMSASSVLPPENEPENININDEDLLEKVSYTDGHFSTVTNLTAPFLLHTACLILRNSCLEEMLREEVLAYLSAIIEGKTFSYCIKTHSYFLRSLLEKVTYRKLCRSMEQLEEVVQGFDCKKSYSRTAHFFVSGLPTMWVQQKLLAELYLKTGSYKSALDIFEKLRLYEDQISTLTIIGRYEAAEKLTRQQLAENETPKLYCILGDNTQDITYYEKAWELSGKTYSRAMKSLGYYYFNVKNPSKALECFLLSLQWNHLQADLWFTAGCTCMSLAEPNFKQAIRCFRESVLINDDDAQTWSNLGACHQRSDDHEKAFKCFKEAIRCQYSNWKIWENFIYAAAQLQHISEVIRAYRQLINLGQKFCDSAILNCLVAAVRDDVTDYRGIQGKEYFDKVVELFKFTSTKVTSSFDMWRCFGAMYLEVEGHVDVTKGIDYNIKAYHALALYIEKFENFMKCVYTAGKLYEYIINEDKSSESYARHLQSLKSILQILVTKGRKLLPTLDDHSEARQSCDNAVTDANQKLEAVEEAQLYV